VRPVAIIEHDDHRHDKPESLVKPDCPERPSFLPGNRLRNSAFERSGCRGGSLQRLAIHDSRSGDDLVTEVIIVCRESHPVTDFRRFSQP